MPLQATSSTCGRVGGFRVNAEVRLGDAVVFSGGALWVVKFGSMVSFLPTSASSSSSRR